MADLTADCSHHLARASGPPCEMGHLLSGRGRGPCLQLPAASRSEHTSVGQEGHGMTRFPGLGPEGREKLLESRPASLPSPLCVPVAGRQV